MRAAPITLALALLAAACGDEDAAPTRPPEHHPPPGGCAPGEWDQGGTCVAAGLPTDGCAPGELAGESGCVPAGVGACGEGFSTDGRGGCVAVLPAKACGKGQLAIPGETACHAVAPCPAGTWGDIPVDAATELVDESFTGASDGTMAAPWKTIQEGIDAAASGAIVAVAAGTYAEDVEIVDKAVRLWGVCPANVEIVGSAGAFSAVLITHAAGSEVHDLAVTGGAIGVAVSGGDGLVLDRVWIHDTGNRGLNVQDNLGPTELSLTRSLVEAAEGTAVFFAGSEGTVEESVLRGSAATSMAFALVHHDTTGARAKGTLRGSLVEGTYDFGATAGGSDLSVEQSVVRRIGAGSTEESGASGIDVWKLDGERGTIAITQSLVEDVQGVGVSGLGSDATVADTVIRAITVAPTGGGNGHGVDMNADDSGDRATVAIQRCLLDGFSQAGVTLYGSDATIESTTLRGGDPASPALVGRGVDAYLDTATGQRTNVQVRGSVVEDTREAGIFVSGSDATVEGTVVRGTNPSAETMDFSHSIALQGDSGVRATATVTGCLLQGSYNSSIYVDESDATIRASVIESAQEMGIFVIGSTSTLEGVVVRDTLPAPGDFGSALQIQSFVGESACAVEVRGCSFERSVGIGVVAVDAELTMSTTSVIDTVPREDGLFGDGVSIVSQEAETHGTVTGSRIAGSARAGISGFGASVSIGATELSCNAIDIDGEEHGGRAYAFENLGGNTCTCDGQESACTAQTSNLQPPDPIMAP